MTTRKMAVFHYPRATSERARWFACVAQNGSKNSAECVGVYETSANDWKAAQREAIAAAKADSESLANHLSRNLKEVSNGIHD